jgi:CH-like domain in sperm protein
MASETVLSWITREMKLSKQVTSFEQDFSSGYLFAEILHRYELVDDLANYSKK